jgi:hypothetical protein
MRSITTSTRLALDHLVDPDEFRHDVFAACFLIHPLDKRRRETVFLAKKDSDFFHRKLAILADSADKLPACRLAASRYFVRLEA